MNASRTLTLLVVLGSSAACATARPAGAPAVAPAPVTVEVGAETRCAVGGIARTCAEPRDVAALLAEPVGDSVVLSDTSDGAVWLQVPRGAEALDVRVRGDVRYEVLERGAAGEAVLSTGTAWAAAGGRARTARIEVPARRAPGTRTWMRLRAADPGEAAELASVAPVTGMQLAGR